MLTNKDLKKIEVELFDTGLDENIRRKIRNSKVCIIDDAVDDLKSLYNGLKMEGFSNLIKFKKSPPINEILSEKYDIVLLDLNNIADEITEDDGLGILRLLKQRDPSLPILVITGQKIDPEANNIINLADMVRKKPVLPSDLANEVDTILKYYHDKFWSALLILKELNKIDIELKKELSFYKRIKLHLYRKGVETRLKRKDEDIVDKIEKVLKIIKNTKSASNLLIKISEMILSYD